jgi:hypothetical protein
MPNRGKLDNAISNFNGALLQADVTKTVSTNEVARMLRYVAMGLIDLAEALKQ